MNTTLTLRTAPTIDSPWLGRYFSQRTKFQYNGKHVTLAAIFELSSPDQFSERIIENVWQEATAAAFSHRALFSEQLIEKILKAANDGLADLTDLSGGALLLIEDSAVHFSTTGNVAVFLKDSSSVSRVSADDGSTNRFAAVTSGPLEEGDELIVTSAQLERALKSQIDSSQLDELMQDNQALAVWIGTQAPAAEIAERGEPRFRNFAKKILPIFTFIGSWISELAARIKIKKIPLHLSLKLGSFKLRLGLVVNILLFLVLLTAIFYGGLFIKRQINKAKTPPPAAETLLTKLAATPVDQTGQFLNSQYSTEAYNNLSAGDQTTFNEKLQERTITVSKPETLQEFPEKIVSADILATKIFAVDATGQLWKFENNALAKIQQNGLIINPRQLAAVKEDRLLVTDETGNIWLFDGTSTQPVSLALPKEIATGKKVIARYQNNLYIYHESDRIIYRVSNYDREITGLSTYAKLDSVSIADIVDFKIFGDAVAISSTGSIQLFRKNQKLGTPFIYAVAPQPYQLLTNNDGSEITITGGRFATTYNATGNIVAERFFLTEAPITIGLLQDNALRYLIADKKLLVIR